MGGWGATTLISWWALPTLRVSYESANKKMNLFSRQSTKADPSKIQAIKTWTYETLAISPDIPISISQLSCSEPGCPPVETVISIMKIPTETYKIHKAVGEIEFDDINRLK